MPDDVSSGAESDARPLLVRGLLREVRCPMPEVGVDGHTIPTERTVGLGPRIELDRVERGERRKLEHLGGDTTAIDDRDRTEHLASSIPNGLSHLADRTAGRGHVFDDEHPLPPNQLIVAALQREVVRAVDLLREAPLHRVCRRIHPRDLQSQGVRENRRSHSRSDDGLNALVLPGTGRITEHVVQDLGIRVQRVLVDVEIPMLARGVHEVPARDRTTLLEQGGDSHDFFSSELT